MLQISPIKLSIAKKLKEDKDYARRFFRRRAQSEIAMSIRELRDKRHMRQVDLATKSDMKQSAVSRIEQAEYSSWSLVTLFRVAEALDARLRVVFEPIENVIEQYEQKDTVTNLEQIHYATVSSTEALVSNVVLQNLFSVTPEIFASKKTKDTSCADYSHNL